MFNADEMSLYWKLVPHSTYLQKEQAAMAGHKMAKEKVSLLFCCNAVGDFSRSLCVSTILYISELWTATVWTHFPSSGTWIRHHGWPKPYVKTGFLITFVPQSRFTASRRIFHKALLLLDNCSSHPTNLNDPQDHIKVVFFPPRTSSLIQPLDQDIMCCFTVTYLEMTFSELHKASARDRDMEKRSAFWIVSDLLEKAGKQLKKQCWTADGSSSGLMSSLTLLVSRKLMLLTALRLQALFLVTVSTT